MPFFSVIIPAFQAEETIRETMESLVSQSFKDFEVIVVNDGSTDHTAGIVQEFSGKLPELRIVEQSNRGLGNARNEGARIAAGHWLAFLDADDVWASAKLQVVKQHIEKNQEVNFIFHAVFERFRNGRIRERVFWPLKNISDLVERGNSIVPSAVVINSNLFQELGGFEEDHTMVEDLLLWMKVLKRGEGMAAISKPLTVYRMAHGITADLHAHLVKVKNTMSTAFERNLINQEAMEIMMKRKYYEAGRQLHKTGNFSEAQRYYRMAELKDLKSRVLIVLCDCRISI
jgi:glycosyltransferase involved in cell wall biosynthesis